MGVKQVSIFLENKPGKMCEMTDVLAANKINMRALSLAETDGFGIVRIIVDDVYETTTAGRFKPDPESICGEPDQSGVSLRAFFREFAGQGIHGLPCKRPQVRRGGADPRRHPCSYPGRYRETVIISNSKSVAEPATVVYGCRFFLFCHRDGSPAQNEPENRPCGS